MIEKDKEIVGLSRLAPAGEVSSPASRPSSAAPEVARPPPTRDRARGPSPRRTMKRYGHEKQLKTCSRSLEKSKAGPSKAGPSPRRRPPRSEAGERADPGGPEAVAPEASPPLPPLRWVVVGGGAAIGERRAGPGGFLWGCVGGFLWVMKDTELEKL